MSPFLRSISAPDCAQSAYSARSQEDVLLLIARMRIKETVYIHEKLRATEAYSSLRALGRSGLILLDIVEDGIILHDKENFLRNVLLSIKESLKKLGARKIITKKGYYWILKPDIKPGEIVRI